MTIQQRIEQARHKHPIVRIGPEEGFSVEEIYIFTKSELHALLQEVQDEQNRNDRHKSVEVLTDHVYSWQEQGKKLTDPEFLNQLQNKLHNAEKVYAYEDGE